MKLLARGTTERKLKAKIAMSRTKMKAVMNLEGQKREHSPSTSIEPPKNDEKKKMSNRCCEFVTAYEGRLSTAECEQSQQG